VPARTPRRNLVWLAAGFAAIWLALSINPRERQDWALENALTVLAVLALVLTRRRLPLSTLSYTLIAAFLCLHTIGAHYTYSEVPYDGWFATITGRSLNEVLGWERNNFDRAVHLAYGLLLAYPIREVLARLTGLRGFWSYFLGMDVTLSSSAVYELIEWGAAMTFGAELGMAYVGAQGDPWDAQKDMALAALGAAVATLVAAGAGAGQRATPGFRRVR
jgi:putative membrane protein